jgi:hypothetical protein
MAYSSADQIKSVEQAFATDTATFTAQILESWATVVADPEIDARLLSAGYTTPIVGTPAAIICTISAMLAAAHGLDSYIGQFTSSEVERAKSLRERARGLLDEIADGKLKVAGMTLVSTGAAVIMDSDPETMPDTAAVVGEDWQWKWPTESREA